MAKILITGAAGFIGFHSVLAIAANPEHEIITIDSLSPATPTALTSVRVRLLKESGVEVVQLDLSRTSALELEARVGIVDLVLHLSAFPGVRVTKSRESEVLRNNLSSFETIATYASQTSARLIYASSSSVYGDTALISACKESELGTFIGKGGYALSKWENECLAFKMLKSGQLRSIGLRLFSVFGTYGREDMAYFKFANQFHRNEPIHVFGSHGDFRDYTPIKYVVDDIKKLINLFLEEARIVEEEFFTSTSVPILNIGSGHPRPLGEIIEVYEKYHGRKLEIIQESRLPMECFKTWSDNQKRNRIFGERSELSFQWSLEEFLKWFEGYRANDES